MRKVLVGLGALAFAGAAAGTGCSEPQENPGGGAGGQAAGSAGTSSKGGTPGAGGGGMTAGSTGVAGSAGKGSGGGANCANGSDCGGSVVGSWTVASSCLTLSGDMDVSRLSLGCPTVPVNGSLETTGTLDLEADGSYTDNTTTNGTVSFPLAPSCLSVSSVAVACDRAARVFSAAGWKTAVCTETNGQCACTLNTTQQGGPGQVASYTEPTGRYTTAGSTLSIDILEYTYCASGNTLTLTPKMTALSGTVTLQKEGGAGGAGGASGAGGSAGAGAGTSGAGGSGGAAGSGGASGAGGSSAGGAAGGSGGATGGSGGSAGGGPTSEGPCDIYAAGETPCVAAHSTVRALFGAYDGNLYQVKRSDGMTHDIPVKSTGGFADSAEQESFCSGSSCTIWRIYDQSGMGNFLEAETPDSTVGGRQGQTAANAAAESLNVSGNKVYSLYTRPSQAYWRDGSQSGLPLGAEPQGVYMVTSGTHFNGGCCYNYGNAQTSRTYEGGPTMDSVYFGNCTIWGKGAGEGPWVMADMEDGIVSGRDTGTNNNSPSMPYDFVTAMEKNNGTTEFALRGSNASMGDLVTIYKGALPNGKNPMKKEGAIVLGSGGDCCYSNNNASEGTFYEGAIVDGYPSDATENAVHENIVSAGYGK